MEKKTPSPFKRDIDRAYKRLQLASMVIGNVSEAYDTGDLKEAYRNAFEFAYHAERLTLLARSLPALTGSPAARPKMVWSHVFCQPTGGGHSASSRMTALQPQKFRKLASSSGLAWPAAQAVRPPMSSASVGPAKKRPGWALPSSCSASGRVAPQQSFPRQAFK